MAAHDRNVSSARRRHRHDLRRHWLARDRARELPDVHSARAVPPAAARTARSCAPSAPAAATPSPARRCLVERVRRSRAQPRDREANRRERILELVRHLPRRFAKRLQPLGLESRSRAAASAARPSPACGAAASRTPARRVAEGPRATARPRCDQLRPLHHLAQRPAQLPAQVPGDARRDEREQQRSDRRHVPRRSPRSARCKYPTRDACSSDLESTCSCSATAASCSGVSRDARAAAIALRPVFAACSHGAPSAQHRKRVAHELRATQEQKARRDQCEEHERE